MVRRLGARRIRRKLILLHTFFSLFLAAVLLLALRPAIRAVVASAEEHAAHVALALATQSPNPIRHRDFEGVTIRSGSAAELSLSDNIAAAARASGRPVVIDDGDGWPALLQWSEAHRRFFIATGRAEDPRDAMTRVYTLVVLSLLAFYFLIALALELLVLPRNVWRPIARLREADAAVQMGRRDGELIHESDMPRDELGEIMRSRNESIRKLREHEAALANALEQLEIVASDLKRKNHLLEAVQRNMAGQERLTSLGMMSAGLAHELNTPLAVLKGAVEQLAENPEKGVDRARADLMLRTVNRLERLSENLLDFARVRPHAMARVELRTVIEDAWELVRLDREATNVAFENRVTSECVIAGDADRLGQVFVNILRNATDAVEGEGSIVVEAARAVRNDSEWVSVHVIDSGPGVDLAMITQLFEPFTTTRLDARGAGLGLAVADSIVREHGGVILVSNAPGGGADFEIMFPIHPSANTPEASA